MNNVLQQQFDRTHSIKRYMVGHYIAALVLIAGLIIACFYVINTSITEQDKYASTINISGRQRMLSQRIALLNQRLVSAQTPSEQEVVRADMMQAAYAMQEGHHTLFGASDDETTIPTAIKLLLFDEKEPLDQSLKDYVAAAIRLAQHQHSVTIDNPDCLYIMRHADDLLIMLDMVVTRYENEAKQKLAFQRQLIDLSIIAIFILISLEVLFIFNPMMRRIVGAHHAAQKANRAKSEFLASMSHEIRTPLNSIIGTAEMMSSYGIHPKQKQRLDTIIYSSEALLDIINDILDFSKVETGNVELEEIAFNLKQLCHDTVLIFTVRAKEKGLKLSCTYHDDVAPYVVGDPARLRQVIFNLVGNAIKFTKYGSVELVVEAYGDLSDTQMQAIRISVKDTGIGIAEDSLNEIFERFRQANNSTTREYGGTGLGLAICKNIVSLMGGELRVDSVLQEGSSFWFVLDMPIAEEMHTQQPENIEMLGELRPLVIDYYNADGDATDARQFHSSDKLEGHVLLVDDNRLNINLAKEMLEHVGLTVICASNGKIALDIVRQSSCTIDMVLMDCLMPLMDGFQATRAIRQLSDADKANVPIIALTANVMEEDRKKCRAAGMDDFLAKPLRTKELYKMIQQWIPVNVETSIADTQPDPQPEKHIPMVDEWIDMAVLKETQAIVEDELPVMVEQFFEDVAQYIEQIRLAVEQCNVEDIVFCAHTIKSPSSSLGAHRLSNMAKQLEHSGREYSESKGIEHLTKEYEELVDIFDATKAAYVNAAFLSRSEH